MCTLAAPLARLNLAQSNKLAQSSMLVESMLNSLFLKRNFFFPLANPSHWLNNCPNTVWYNSQGRCSLAYAKVLLFGGLAMPKCFILPSIAFSPLQISRNDLACPNWQNNIATN